MNCQLPRRNRERASPKLVLRFRRSAPRNKHLYLGTTAPARANPSRAAVRKLPAPRADQPFASLQWRGGFGREHQRLMIRYHEFSIINVDSHPPRCGRIEETKGTTAPTQLASGAAVPCSPLICSGRRPRGKTANPVLVARVLLQDRHQLLAFVSILIP